MNIKLIATAATCLVLAFLLLLLLFPQKDICSDDVRGYEQSASSYLEAVRTSLAKIKASLNTEEKVKVPSQLEGLTPTNFAALKACDTQCKLLSRCLRFVFTQSPSVACPTEYRDYKIRTDTALAFLGDLQELDSLTKQALSKSQQLSRARDTVKEIERSSGSTGGRLALARKEAADVSGDFEQKLRELDNKASALTLTK